MAFCLNMKVGCFTFEIMLNINIDSVAREFIQPTAMYNFDMIFLFNEIKEKGNFLGLSKLESYVIFQIKIN